MWGVTEYFSCAHVIYESHHNCDKGTMTLQSVRVIELKCSGYFRRAFYDTLNCSSTYLFSSLLCSFISMKWRPFG